MSGTRRPSDKGLAGIYLRSRVATIGDRGGINCFGSIVILLLRIILLIVRIFFILFFSFLSFLATVFS